MDSQNNYSNINFIYYLFIVSSQNFKVLQFFYDRYIYVYDLLTRVWMEFSNNS